MNAEQAKKREYYDGLVGHPGKFEGEPPWTIYFHDLYLDGDGEYVTEEVHQFEVEDEDIEIFPELQGCSFVELHFSEQGFVASSRIIALDLL